MAPNDYGTPSSTHKSTRIALIANHALHFISSVIVLGIASYFIAAYTHTTHLRYWVGLSAADILLYTPALFLPFVKSYKGYLAPFALVFSYLWLIAFVFAVQDYNYNWGPWWTGPRVLGKNGLKRTLEAFAFLAFFTNFVGVCLEARLWYVQRYQGRDARTADADKHPGHAGPAVGNAPATVTV